MTSRNFAHQMESELDLQIARLSAEISRKSIRRPPAYLELDCAAPAKDQAKQAPEPHPASFVLRVCHASGTGCKDALASSGKPWRTRWPKTLPAESSCVLELHKECLGREMFIKVIFSNHETLPSSAKLFVGQKKNGPFELACPDPLLLPANTKQQLVLAADSMGSQDRFLKVLFLGNHLQGQGMHSVDVLSVSGHPGAIEHDCHHDPHAGSRPHDRQSKPKPSGGTWGAPPRAAIGHRTLSRDDQTVPDTSGSKGRPGGAVHPGGSSNSSSGPANRQSLKAGRDRGFPHPLGSSNPAVAAAGKSTRASGNAIRLHKPVLEYAVAAVRSSSGSESWSYTSDEEHHNGYTDTVSINTACRMGSPSSTATPERPPARPAPPPCVTLEAAEGGDGGSYSAALGHARAAAAHLQGSTSGDSSAELLLGPWQQPPFLFPGGLPGKDAARSVALRPSEAASRHSVESRVKAGDWHLPPPAYTPPARGACSRGSGTAAAPITSISGLEDDTVYPSPSAAPHQDQGQGAVYPSPSAAPHQDQGQGAVYPSPSVAAGYSQGPGAMVPSPASASRRSQGQSAVYPSPSVLPRQGPGMMFPSPSVPRQGSDSSLSAMAALTTGGAPPRTQGPVSLYTPKRPSRSALMMLAQAMPTPAAAAAAMPPPVQREGGFAAPGPTAPAPAEKPERADGVCVATGDASYRMLQAASPGARANGSASPPGLSPFAPAATCSPLALSPFAPASAPLQALASETCGSSEPPLPCLEPNQPSSPGAVSSGAGGGVVPAWMQPLPSDYSAAESIPMQYSPLRSKLMQYNPLHEMSDDGSGPSASGSGASTPHQSMQQALASAAATLAAVASIARRSLARQRAEEGSFPAASPWAQPERQPGEGGSCPEASQSAQGRNGTEGGAGPQQVVPHDGASGAVSPEKCADNAIEVQRGVAGRGVESACELPQAVLGGGVDPEVRASLQEEMGLAASSAHFAVNDAIRNISSIMDSWGGGSGSGGSGDRRVTSKDADGSSGASACSSGELVACHARHDSEAPSGCVAAEPAALGHRLASSQPAGFLSLTKLSARDEAWGSDGPMQQQHQHTALVTARNPIATPHMSPRPSHSSSLAGSLLANAAAASPSSYTTKMPSTHPAEPANQYPPLEGRRRGRDVTAPQGHALSPPGSAPGTAPPSPCPAPELCTPLSATRPSPAASISSVQSKASGCGSNLAQLKVRQLESTQASPNGAAADSESSLPPFHLGDWAAAEQEQCTSRSTSEGGEAGNEDSSAGAHQLPLSQQASATACLEVVRKLPPTPPPPGSRLLLQASLHRTSSQSWPKMETGVLAGVATRPVEQQPAVALRSSASYAVSFGSELEQRASEVLQQGADGDLLGGRARSEACSCSAAPSLSFAPPPALSISGYEGEDPRDAILGIMQGSPLSQRHQQWSHFEDSSLEEDEEGRGVSAVAATNRPPGSSEALEAPWQRQQQQQQQLLPSPSSVATATAAAAADGGADAYRSIERRAAAWDASWSSYAASSAGALHGAEARDVLRQHLANEAVPEEDGEEAFEKLDQRYEDEEGTAPRSSLQMRNLGWLGTPTGQRRVAERGTPPAAWSTKPQAGACPGSTTSSHPAEQDAWLNEGAGIGGRSRPEEEEEDDGWPVGGMRSPGARATRARTGGGGATRHVRKASGGTWPVHLAAPSTPHRNIALALVVPLPLSPQLLDPVRLITPLRELNRVPGAQEMGPLQRGILRRQAGLPQGRNQEHVPVDPQSFVGPLAYGLMHHRQQQAALTLVRGVPPRRLTASGWGESPELMAALLQQRDAQRLAAAGQQEKQQQQFSAADLPPAPPRRRTEGDKHKADVPPSRAVGNSGAATGIPQPGRATTTDYLPTSPGGRVPPPSPGGRAAPQPGRATTADYLPTSPGGRVLPKSPSGTAAPASPAFGSEGGSRDGCTQVGSHTQQRWTHANLQQMETKLQRALRVEGCGEAAERHHR